MDILLTEADNQVGKTLIGRFADLGLSVGAAVDFTHPASELGVPSYPVPPCKDRGNFVKAVAALNSELHPRWILPVFWPEDLAGTGLPVLCESADKLLALDDKLSCCALASGLGVPQPALYASPGDVPAYPVVFKRTDGHSGQSVYFPKERRTLDHLCSSAKPGTYLIQEFVRGGEEISVDALRWGSELFFAAPYKVLEPVGRKGISTKRISVEAPVLAGYAKALLDAVDYNGVAGFDFIVSGDDSYFLECNPRFTGGLPSAIASGFDMPGLLLRLASGEPVSSLLSASAPRFVPGIVTH